MTNPTPPRPGATTGPAVPPVELDVDLAELDVTGLRELQHRIEEELATVETTEPAGTGQPPPAAASADPERSARLRQLLIDIDSTLAGHTDTAEQPTGE